MLTSKVRKRIEIPHEPGEWIEIRQLSGRALERAAEARVAQLIEHYRGLSGDVLRFIREEEDHRILEPAEAETQQNPLVKYDVDTLLRAGIVGWSYDARVTPENVEDLDAATREWAARELLALGDRTEEDRKNG